MIWLTCDTSGEIGLWCGEEPPIQRPSKWGSGLCWAHKSWSSKTYMIAEAQKEHWIEKYLPSIGRDEIIELKMEHVRGQI